MIYVKTIAILAAVLLIVQACQPGAEQSATERSYAMDAADVTPPLTGTQIPDVKLRDVRGDTVELLQLASQEPTVLIFYRGGWCPYCSRHLAQLQEAHSKLVDMGYQVLAVSPDSPGYLKQSLQEKDLGYTLLSDSPMTASKAFGIAFKLDPTTARQYKNNGMDLAERSGYDHHLLPVPAVFLLDQKGQILFQYVNPDYKTRIKSEVLLAAAEAWHPSKTPAGD